MAPVLQIELLGTFRLVYDSAPLSNVNSARLQALLAYLVLHANAPQPRQHLAFQFWPDSSESQARTNLRKLFYQLRNALPDADRFLTYNSQTVGWNPAAPFALDVAAVQQLVAQIQENPQDRTALTEVTELYSGELLPSCYDDWIIPLRQQLARAVQNALDGLVTLLENQRAYEEGVRYAQRLLAFDPLQEQSYQRLMRLRALNGDRAGALHTYQECVAVLQRELGVEPSVETQAVYERLLNNSTEHVLTTQKKPEQTEGPPLVGRQREWQTLQAAWRNAVQGGAHFVCIWGEAGIGKTRLTEELWRWTGQQGILTARTRSYQAQGALVHAPVTDLLRSAGLRARLSALNDVWLSEVARLLPELLTERPDLPPPQPMTESWQRQRFFEALTRAVLVDDQPLLLVLDDLQWCDAETLEWIHYLLRFAPQARLLVVGASRVEEVDANHPLAALQLTLRREDLVTEINLAPLSATDVAKLARSLSDGALVVKQIEQLYTHTEGNPLFVVETVRAGLDDTHSMLQHQTAGSADTVVCPSLPAHLPIPPKIYAVIQSRLGQLSARAQTIASLAAVIGRSFTFDVLVAAAQEEEEAVVDSLDELWERRIIREQGAEAYDFSHDRIRDVAYGEISRARRRLLHRRVAAALETIYADRLDERSGILAEQYAAAGCREEAVHYFQRAGDHAAAQFAYEEALRYYARGIELAPESGYANLYALHLGRADILRIQGNRRERERDLQRLEQIVEAWPDDARSMAQRRAEVAVRWQSHESQQGNHQAAIAYVRRAVQAAAVAGDPELEARSLMAWGDALWIISDFATAGEKFEQAHAKAKAAGSPFLMARSRELFAQTCMFMGVDADTIMGYLREALMNYEKAGDLTGKCNILNKLGYLPVAQGTGDYREAQVHYEQALALSRRMGISYLESNILRNLGVLFACAGQYIKALSCVEKALEIVAHSENVFHTAVTQNYLGYVYFQQGNPAEAKVTQCEALDALRAINNRHWEVKALTNLSQIYYALGEHEVALAHARQAVQLAEQIGEKRHEGYACASMGHILLALERPGEAAEFFQRAYARHCELKQSNRSMEPLAGLAQVALAQGDLPRAQGIVEDILRHLKTHTLDRTEEAFQVYLTCYKVLCASGDARADTMLHTAYNQLQERTATIADPAQRRLFWEGMPGRRRILDGIGEAI